MILLMGDGATNNIIATSRALTGTKRGPLEEANESKSEATIQANAQLG